MIIGLVLCGLVAVLLFFGIAERVFKSFGVAGWLGFVFIGVLVGSAFIPSFSIGAVRFNVAGFFAPLLFAAVFFFLAVRTHEALHALVTTSVIVALFIAVWLLIQPITNDTVTVIIVGFLCGAVSYLVGKTKLSSLAALFLGMPIGEVISSAVGMYVYGTPMQFGTAATFDAVILAAVFSVVLSEAISAIKRAVNNKAHRKQADMLLNTEAAEEFDKDEYKKYFDE
ncbi:MAG: hypothetical protein HDT28_06220 [Clostridiales bacterium]|nr:hypothetical protein [Clostridiales bacterium]